MRFPSQLHAVFHLDAFNLHLKRKQDWAAGNEWIPNTIGHPNAHKTRCDSVSFNITTTLNLQPASSLDRKTVPGRFSTTSIEERQDKINWSPRLEKTYIISALVTSLLGSACRGGRGRSFRPRTKIFHRVTNLSRWKYFRMIRRRSLVGSGKGHLITHSNSLAYSANYLATRQILHLYGTWNRHIYMHTWNYIVVQPLH